MSTDPTVLKKLSDDLEKLGVYASVTLAAGQGDFIKALASVDSQLAMQLSDIAREQALTMFYANEAYQSDGPFAHVVTAGQAVETDIKTELAKERVGAERFNAMTAGEREVAIKEAWGEDNSEQRKTAQGRVADEMTKRRAALPPDQCLQSFNEHSATF